MEDPARPFLRIFDPDDLWAGLSGLSREVLEKTGTAASAVRAVTATGQRLSDLFLDAEGRALYAGPNMDARGLFAEGLAGDPILEEEIHAITGQWPPLLSTLARLLWHREEEPSKFQRIRRVLMLNDWILYKLSGEMASEPTAASTSFVLDIATRRWSRSVLDRFSLDPSLLPPLATAGQVIGKLTASAAKACGLEPNTPVVVSGSDTHCGILGAGVVEPGEVGIIAGTTTPVCLVLDTPVIDPERRTWTCCHVMSNQWALEANAQWTGAVYQWLHDLLKEDFFGDRDSASCYRFMEDKARAVAPGSDDTFAMLGPTVMDARKLTVLRPGVFLFPPPTNPMVEKPASWGHLVRSALENIAYAIQGNLELLKSIHAPVPPGKLHLTGGLCNSRLFVEILADVVGLPLSVARVRNGTALGAAVCAAVGAGWYPDLPRAVQHMVQFEAPVEPVAEHAGVYRSGFVRWNEIWERLEDL